MFYIYRKPVTSAYTAVLLSRTRSLFMFIVRYESLTYRRMKYVVHVQVQCISVNVCIRIARKKYDTAGCESESV